MPPFSSCTSSSLSSQGGEMIKTCTTLLPWYVSPTSRELHKKIIQQSVLFLQPSGFYSFTLSNLLSKLTVTYKS